MDPDAFGDLLQCESKADTTLPCSLGVQTNWVVTNTMQARAMAKAVHCSGGKFSVEWRGNIAVEKTIYVSGGTVLRLSGWGNSSGMDGGLERRLFTVKNATLNLSNVTIKYGSAPVGGAIAASASNITLTRVSFTNNKAATVGGAIFAVDGCRVRFDGDVSMFSDNAAGGNGGAIYAFNGSDVSWLAQTIAFVNNSAGKNGGAVFLSSRSLAACTGNSTFMLNKATSGSGGVLAIVSWSVASWRGESLFCNNTSSLSGGAVAVFSHSHVSWRGDAAFSSNHVGYFGGALHIAFYFSASWIASSAFAGNNAGSAGGALDVSTNSTVAWNEGSFFHGNKAGYSCGAISIRHNSYAIWKSDTTLRENVAAKWAGGAVCVIDTSSASWAGDANFSANKAKYSPAPANSDITHFTTNHESLDNGVGGAVFVQDNSDISYSSEAVFIGNTAFTAGALYAGSNSTASFYGTVIFDGNTANGGSAGALGVESATIFWGGERTIFSGNSADENGGAVASVTNHVDPRTEISTLVIAGPTTFLDNTSGTNGGAVSVINGPSIAFETADVTFENNSAGGNGGAIYLCCTDLGPHFFGLNFVGNTAKYGGGVYSMGGINTTKLLSDAEVVNTATFDKCTFQENSAMATGGAIHSTAENVYIVNSVFVGNTPDVDGALRLQRTARIENCTLVGNRSEPDDGSAASNTERMPMLY